MKKKLLLIFAGVAVLLLVAGALVVMKFMGPAYEPGMVRAGEDLDAPLDPPPGGDRGDGFWRVTEQVKLYHFETGQGSPLLFLHGGPGYPVNESLKGLDLLGDEHRVLYYHQRGCGRSTRPIDRFAGDGFMANAERLNKELGIGTQVADIERIRRLLGQEQLTMVGFSFGGFIASLYAAEFPERVRALILIAPADLVVFPTDDEGNIYKQVRALLPAEKQTELDAYTAEMFDFAGVFEKSETELAAFNRRFVDFYLLALERRPGGQKMAAAVEKSAEKSTGIGGWVQPGIFFSLGMRHDYRAALAKVKAPVLILHGSDDLQSEAVSRGYTGHFPNSRFHVIQGGGHFMCDEKPEDCANIIRGFLAGLS